MMDKTEGRGECAHGLRPALRTAQGICGGGWVVCAAVGERGGAAVRFDGPAELGGVLPDAGRPAGAGTIPGQGGLHPHPAGQGGVRHGGGAGVRDAAVHVPLPRGDLRKVHIVVSWVDLQEGVPFYKQTINPFLPAAESGDIGCSLSYDIGKARVGLIQAADSPAFFFVAQLKRKAFRIDAVKLRGISDKGLITVLFNIFYYRRNYVRHICGRLAPCKYLFCRHFGKIHDHYHLSQIGRAHV